MELGLRPLPVETGQRHANGGQHGAAAQPNRWALDPRRQRVEAARLES
jgi:hypothetical protein